MEWRELPVKPDIPFNDKVFSETPMPAVLLVDDDRGTRETLSWALRSGGYDPYIASSGNSAIKLFHQLRPGALVVDLCLPDTTGIDVVKRIRSEGSQVPAFIMTAFPSIDSAVAAIKAGAVDYLQKPFDIDLLLGKLARTLSAPDDSKCTAPDGLTLWVSAFWVALSSTEDLRTTAAWANAQGVSPETLRGWCRASKISPKRTLDLARVLRAVHLSRLADVATDRYLYSADRRTLARLRRILPPTYQNLTLSEIVENQRSLTDTTIVAALKKLVMQLS